MLGGSLGSAAPARSKHVPIFLNVKRSGGGGTHRPSLRAPTPLARSALNARAAAVTLAKDRGIASEFQRRLHRTNSAEPIRTALANRSNASTARTTQPIAAFHALALASRHAPSS